MEVISCYLQQFTAAIRGMFRACQSRGRVGQQVMVTSNSAMLVDADCRMTPLEFGTVLTIGAVEGIWIWVYRGWVIFYQVQPVERVMRKLTAEIERWPSADAFNRRGLANCGLGEISAACDDFTEALRLGPDLENYCNRAVCWQGLGELDRALQDLTEALRLDPHSGQALANRGLVWMRKQEFDKAIEDYSRALDLFAYKAPLLLNRSSAWLEKGELDRALVDLEAALALAPNDPLIMQNLSLVWERKGDALKSLQYREQSLQLNPLDTQQILLFASQKLDQDRYDEALAELDNAIFMDPNLADAYQMRGVVWSRLKDDVRALQDYNEALRLNPRDSVTYCNRGVVHFNQARYEQAIDDYEMALKWNPEYLLAYNNLAELLAGCPVDSLRDGQRALRYAKHACEQSPKKAGYFDTLALAYAELGDFESAIEQSRVAIAMCPPDAHYLPELRARLESYCRRLPYRAGSQR